MATVNPAAEALLAARVLREALSGLADALEGGRLSGVLEAEPTLSMALASISSARSRLTPTDFNLDGRAALKTELEHASAALARCAALGGALDDLIRGRCGVAAYGASGRAIPIEVRGALEEQV
jgi:hypothetical protein